MLLRVDNPNSPPLSLARETACVRANVVGPPTQRLRERQMALFGSQRPRVSSIPPMSLKRQGLPAQRPLLPGGLFRMTLVPQIARRAHAWTSKRDSRTSFSSLTRDFFPTRRTLSFG